MKSFRKELWFQARERREFINITPQVQQALRESGIQEGLLLRNATHVKASVPRFKTYDLVHQAMIKYNLGVNYMANKEE